MATSLAQQLQRLKAPQTALLVDKNKRASILFDPREAAKKDRDTIYDIGLSGLQELIAINPNFDQFKATLFERTAKDVERSVGTKEMNRLIAKTIKRFTIQMSPYFMIQSSHKCIEWLLRRFNSHMFDRDSLMAIILPFHETRMFVKCLQVFDLSDAQDKWHWLAAVQSPGIPLNKQTLFNRAASDPFFFEFICKTTLDAVKELGNRASTLQVQFAFYCTTIIGALQYKVTEQQVSTLLAVLLKGISSDAIDFCAASLMILAQLITCTQISQKTLDAITLPLAAIAHPSLHQNVVMIFALMLQNQQEYRQISDGAFNKLIASTWIPSEIARAGSDGVDTMPLLSMLLSKCLHNILMKESDWKLCRKFADSILSEAISQSEDATPIIQCVLDSYVTTENPEAVHSEDEIVTIDLDSDDEMGESVYDLECNEWYSNYLRQLERQFPVEFDKIIAETIRGKETASVKRRKSFKIILSFLFKVTCSEKDANIFENIYHHSSQHRAMAVRSLAETLASTAVTPESKDLLREILSERLCDDDPNVVIEVLKIDISQLEEILGKSLLIKKLTFVLQGGHSSQKWNTVMEKVATILTSDILCQDVCVEEIMLATFKYFFPSNIGDTKLLMIILKSCFSDKNQVLKKLREKVEKTRNLEDIENVVVKHLESGNGVVNVTKLLQILTTQYDEKKLSNEGLYNGLWLLSFSLRKTDGADVGLSALELISKISSNAKIHLINVDLKGAPSSIKSNQIPIQLLTRCVGQITKDISISSIFTESGLISPSVPEFLLVDKLFYFLVTNTFKSNQNDQPIYRTELSNFLSKVVPTFDNKMEFFTYFLMLESQNIESLEFKIRTIRLFNIILQKASEELKQKNLSVTPVQIGRLSIGLTHKVSLVRQCLFETLEVIHKIIGPQEQYSIYLGHLMQRREEILLDPEQLPLILFTLLNTKKKIFVEVLEDFMKCIENTEISIEFKGKLLNLLRHTNSNDILKRVAKHSLNILREYSIGDSVIVNPSHSLLYKNSVLKYDQSTVKVLNASSSDSVACFDLLIDSMRRHCLLMQIDNKLISPAVLVFEQFEEDIFDILSEKLKIKFIAEVIRTATTSSDPSVINGAGKLFKKLDLSINLFLTILTAMKTCIVAKSASEVVNALEWKCGLTLLELFQIKKKINDSHKVVAVFFDILEKSLAAEEQSPFEYAKQLILSCILQCCQNSSTSQLPKSVFRVDLIIQCIRASPNPQTHHHALLLLSKMAAIVPEQVLLNVVSIFTFVGSSVVNHDDAYSFQIINNIIETIIPQLVQSGGNDVKQDALVIQVLKVFAGTILDVPEHRRLPVFVKLLTSLNPSKYLWMFLVILFDMHVLADTDKGDKRKNHPKDEEHQPPRIEVALTLVREFEPAVAIETCTALLDYMLQLFNEKDKDEDAMDVDKLDIDIFNPADHTGKQMRHFKYVILLFISKLTQSIQFVQKVVCLNNAEDHKKMKPLYKNLIISILFFIPECSKAADKTTDLSQTKYWKAMIHHCYDILDNSISLLSPDMLLTVVHNLMHNKIALVRRKVIELVNNKLQHDPDYFNDCDSAIMIELLGPLTEIVKTVLSDEKIVENITPNDQVILQQSALITIKLLSKKLAENYKPQFKEILDLNTKILKNHTKVHRNILAAVVLCLSEICAHLKAESLVYLSKFMPSVVKIIEQQSESLNIDSVLLGLMTALHKIIETLPLFLSPYLVRIVRHLSEIWRKLLAEQGEGTKCGSILNKLTAIWQKLATVLPLRVLIPTIDQSYSALTSAKEYLAVCPLMDLMIESLKRVDSAEISSLQSDVVNLFMNALQLRENTSESGMDETSLADIDMVEGKIIGAFVVMVLKLSESSFRVLFHKIRGWALDDPSHKERAITFYRLSSEVADSLKSLFVLFAASFIENSALILNDCNTLHCSDGAKALYFEESNDKTALLLKYMLKTLQCVFMHNTQNFMNSTRVDILMQPIVDQLENDIVLQNEELADLLISTISQLAVAVSDDIIWKQLNYQILLKTRNNSAEIRLIGLKATIGVARKIGEEFLPLLPETIPFLSELLEDETQEVERACQKAVNELEKILGEPLQKYF